MQQCIRCRSEMPDGAPFCPWCGKSQLPQKRTSHRRGNGLGTAYKRGRTWTAMVILGYKRQDGKKVAIKNTKGGFLSKTDALLACPGLLNDDGKRPKKVYPDFNHVYEQWEKEYLTKGKTKSTLNCYRGAKKYFDSISLYPFNEIGVEDLQGCVDDCPKGKRTRENMKALASLMYKYAIPRHWSDMNYAEYITPGGEAGGTYPPFTDKQVKIIRQSVGKIPHADDILCLIYTGLRPTEMFGIRKEDYHEQDGIAYVIAGIKTKAGKGRAVTLSPVVADIFKARSQGESEFLFPKDDGTQMSAEYFRDNYFYQTLDKMGIQAMPTKEKPAELVPYSCRHTFSNLLKNAQGADKDKAALIGHEDYKTTKKMYQTAELQSMYSITIQLH